MKPTSILYSCHVFARSTKPRLKSPGELAIAKAMLDLEEKIATHLGWKNIKRTNADGTGQPLLVGIAPGRPAPLCVPQFCEQLPRAIDFLRYLAEVKGFEVWFGRHDGGWCVRVDRGDKEFTLLAGPVFNEREIATAIANAGIAALEER